VSFDKLDPRILPDMGVKVAFLSEEPRKDTKGPVARAIVPKTAVQTDGGTSIIYVVKEQKLERHAVTLGSERGSDVEILAGISPGDSVVIRGAENLRDGQAVAVKQ
jgi:multidrug efflux pump subunit AcrA (membrane-fusion protein)